MESHEQNGPRRVEPSLTPDDATFDPAPPAPAAKLPVPSLLPDEPEGPPALSGILQEKPPADNWIGTAVAWGGGALALAALIGGGVWFNAERKLDDAMHAVAMSAKVDPAAPPKPVAKPPPKAALAPVVTEPVPDNTSPPPGRITPAPEPIPPLVVLPPEPEKPVVNKPVEIAHVEKPLPVPKPKPKPAPPRAHPLAATVVKKAPAAKPVAKARAPAIPTKKPLAKAKAPVVPVKPAARKNMPPAPAKAAAKKKLAVVPAKAGVKPKVAAKPAAKPAVKAKPAPAKPVAGHQPAFKLHTPANADPCKSGGLAREC
ncbi:hypothetical protein [Massilia rubra]|uniref:Uncharacterized protein n=1 Tax=Massilia rubra TaxID=2607910 RepID=A0ABX0LDR9_9BURK|nr:hypothetical protein [Massilia rubra]NHZ32783.1 hypothetical protein [Massilia rubra]